jgi:hypothetical protein
VVKLTVGTSTDFVNDSWLEVNKDSTRNMLASTSLREEGVESVVFRTDGLVIRDLSIRLNTVLEAEEFPAGITDLDTGLTNMNGDDFTVICGQETTTITRKNR